MAVMKTLVRLPLLILLCSAPAAGQDDRPLAALAFSDQSAIGRFGSGLSLAGGPDGYLADAAGVSNAFTFEAWINPSSFVWSDLWRQRPGASGGNPIYTLSTTPSGAIYFSAYLDDVAYPMFTTPTLAAHAWTHVAVTYDGVWIRIYFNAVEVGRRGARGSLAPTSEPMEFGAGFPGRLDEVRVYGRALSAAELALDRATPVDPLEPLQVAVFTPADGAPGVTGEPISATFSAPVDPSAIVFELRDAADVVVAAAVSYDAAARTAVVVPAAPLLPLADYTARIVFGSGGVSWTFRTAAPLSEPRVALAFSEGAGEAASDGSGNGNAGSLLHGAAWSTGMFGAGVQFDGVNADLRVPSRDSTTIADAFTFEAWVNPSVYAWGYLWSQYPDDGGNFLYVLAISDKGTLYTAPHLSGIDYPLFTTVTLPLNTWTHVALSYDGACLRVYVDGLEVASRAAHGSLPPTPEPTEIGQWFHGAIDEVRIYNRALSAGEILVDRQTPVDSASPFAVTMVTPKNGARGIIATPVTAAFSASVDPATLTSSSFELRDSANTAVPATVTYDAATRTATLTPASALVPLAEYTAQVSTAVAAAGGAALTSAVTWSFRTAAATPAPSVAYAFSESSGVWSDDWSGNGNVASLVRGAGWGSGVFGGGVTLSGGSSEVVVASSDSIALTGAFTFEAWVNASSAGQPWLWSRSPDDTGSNPLYVLAILGSGVLYFDARLGDVDVPLMTQAIVPLNVWTHVAVTFDGAWLRLYLNGVESASRTASGTLGVTNEPMEIGKWFTGRLDEVRVYRRALSAQDIGVDMNTPVDGRQSMIASIAPASGPSGQSVTITGVNFGVTQGSSLVTFNGVAAAVAVWSDTSLVVVVPGAVTSGPVVVTKQGVQSNGVTFTVTGPRISAAVSPAPNGFGWNNSSVTVTFTCTAAGTPISFCTAPQVVSFSGTGIRVTGRAVDQNGVTATMTVLLNVDLAGPSVNVYSPKATAVFAPGTMSVPIRGSVVDVLSGASTVTCAGVPAALTGQNFSCAVPVVDGTNTVPVVGVDVAGRTTSRNVAIVVADVEPASLTVSPAAVTLLEGTAQPLMVADDRGRAVSGGTWASSAPDVATVSVDAGVPTVHALVAGSATLTLSRDTLSAQTMVTVVAATAAPPDGTMLWSLTATPNPQPALSPGRREVVRAVSPFVPGNSLVVPPAFYFVERAPFNASQGTTVLPSLIRAVSADGRELWNYPLPLDGTFAGYRPVRQVVPDDRGGLILLVGSSQPACCYRLNESIMRLDGWTGEVSWEYRHRETNGRFSELALHPSGTLFVVEKLSSANTADLVAIDTVLGSVIARHDLTGGSPAYPRGFTATSPLVQDDGSVVTIVSRWENVTLSTAPRSAWRVTLPAALSTTTANEELRHADGTSVSLGVGDILSGPWPDGAGGLIVGGVSPQTESGLATLVHVGADLTTSPTMELPFGTLAARELQYVLSDDAAYILLQYWEGSGQPGGKWFEVNPVTLGILDSLSLTGGPNLQMTDAQDGGGALFTSHSQGDASSIGWGLLAGWSGDTPVVQAAATVTVADTKWPHRRGVSGRNDASNPRLGIFVKAQPVVALVAPSPFLHTSVRIVPRDQRRWAGAPDFRQNPFGEWYLTIGAESDPAGQCSGLLKSDLNRPDDLNPTNFIYRERLQYPDADEAAIILGLLNADDNYGDDLAYQCFPALVPGTYNSNSYTHGLLNKVGLPSPVTPYLAPYLHPGWQTPVPSSEFDAPN